MEREKKEKKKKKKGAYGKVLGFCVLVGCVAGFLAMFGGDGFGFGGGGFGLGGSGNGNGNEPANGTNGGGYVSQNNTPDNDTEENPGYENGNEGNNIGEEPVELVIRVVGNSIYHGERELTTTELTQLFDDVNQPGFTWELHDEQAIMETFELVQMIMRENEVAYTIR